MKKKLKWKRGIISILANEGSIQTFEMLQERADNADRWMKEIMRQVVVVEKK